MGDLRKVGDERVNIVLSEADLNSRFLAARLHGSCARHNDHQLRAEIGKDVLAGLAESIAISEQHDHGGNAPGHAQHGESGAAPVVAHRRVRFAEQITKHVSSVLASLLP
jgi:hypothetical protein